MIKTLFHALRIPMLVLAIGVFAAPPNTYAQNAPDRPRTQRNRQFARPQGGQRFEQLLQQLNLTDEQKTKITPIVDNLRKQTRDAMTGNTDQAQRRQSMRQAMQDAQKQLRDVLTPEQQTKLAQLMREQRAATSQPAAGQNAFRSQAGMIDRLERAAMELNLSDDQQAKVKDLSKEYRDEVAAVLRDGAQADRQQLRTILTEYRSRLTQLLTPEQTDQFNTKLGRLAVESPFPGGRGQGQNRRGAGAN